MTKLNWRQILIHFAAIWLVFQAFFTLSILSDIKLIDKIGVNFLLDGGAWWGDIGVSSIRFNNFTLFTSISSLIGIVIATLISLKMSIERHWFWVNCLVAFILTTGILALFHLLGLTFVLKAIWYPGELIKNTTLTFLINGLLLLVVGLSLFFSIRINHFIEKGA